VLHICQLNIADYISCIKMQCTWPSSDICQKIFKAIQHTNTTVNVTFDQQGLHIMTMDSSHTSLIRMELNPDFFNQWKCQVPITLGLHTEVLVNMLLKAKKSQISWHVPNDTQLNIQFEKDGRVTSFSLRAIDIDDEALAIPEMVDDVGLFASNTTVKDWMDTVMMTKGDIQFKLTKEDFKCSSETIEFGEVVVQEMMNGNHIELHNHKEDVSITINHNGAKSMAIYSACGQKCYLGVSNAMPAHLKIALDDNQSYIEYFIAPKMEE